MKAIMKDTNLAGADLSGADLTGANLERANLAGAKFGAVRMSGATWTDGKSKCKGGSVGECKR